jgi:hypothetical protein
VCFYAAGIGLVTALFLLAPPAHDPAQFCGETMHLGHLLSFPMNCDSMDFIDDAILPVLLLNPQSGRQDRPLFVALAALPTRILITFRLWRLVPTRTYEAVAAAPGLLVHYDKHHPPISWQLYPKYVICAYVSYVMVNGILILAALLLFHWLALKRLDKNTIVLALAAMLLATDVVKAFFWTPHTQMFNVVMPLGSVLLCQEVLRCPCRSILSFGCIGIGTGVLSLAYGSFAVWILACVATLLLSAVGKGRQLSVPASLQRSLAILSGFAVPTLAWIAVCEVVVGSYTNLAMTQDHEIVWIFESLHRSM